MISKPIDQIKASDIDELCARGGAYEDLTLEFKRELSSRDGKPDPWMSGTSNFTNYARDRLFREVVAFANAQGGTLVLGIDETEDEPKRAARVVPIPRVHDLAVRLEAAARACIDPPLPALQVQGVMTDGASGGVVVFRTAGSPFGPHRVMSDGHAFIRRGSSSVRMTMREIQDLTLNLARRADRLEALFGERASAFTQWFRYSNLAEIAALRVTAVPLGTLPQTVRIADQRDDIFLKPEFRAQFEGSGQIQMVRPQLPSYRPILRGYRYYESGEQRAAQLDILDSGVVDFWYWRTVQAGTHLHMGWVLATFLTVLGIINWLRRLAEAPEWEFGIELAFDGFNAAPAPDARVPLTLIVIADFASGNIRLPGSPLLFPLRFPRLASRSASDNGDLLNLVYRDLLDAAGEGVAPPRLTVLE
jgi:hypothetical protein